MSTGERPISLRELIQWVKQELLSEEAQKKDQVPLFTIDEVTVEVNFVVDGKLKSGFSALRIVEAGSEVSEKRVQKAIIKMTPILERQQMIDELVTLRPEIAEGVKSKSARAFLKGRVEDESTVAPR
jgi:hypothetical protein